MFGLRGDTVHNENKKKQRATNCVAYMVSGMVLGFFPTQQPTFKFEYFCKFETEFKNFLGCEFGDYLGTIRGKNRR